MFPKIQIGKRMGNSAAGAEAESVDGITAALRRPDLKDVDHINTVS
jgi:hypothetical protein